MYYLALKQDSSVSKASVGWRWHLEDGFTQSAGSSSNWANGQPNTGSRLLGLTKKCAVLVYSHKGRSKGYAAVDCKRRLPFVCEFY